jgi:hypothetical protein
MEKLRQKMKLLIEVALGEDSKGPAGMKTRQAKVSEVTAEYTETRAMIELRLGLLSMQYGILLSWDSRSGKIVFMVLRKICHDYFYSSLCCFCILVCRDQQRCWSFKKESVGYLPDI